MWIAFIVGAAFANRHFLLRRAARGVLGDGGTGEGPHTGPHLHEERDEYQVTMLTSVPRELDAS